MRPDLSHPDQARRTLSGPRRLRAWTWLVAVLAATALVAGAFFASGAFRGPDSDEATLQGFQIRVLNVSQAAAENRLDGALDALNALEKDLDAAAGGGLVSASRYRGIEAALKAVRADITGHIEAQTAAVAEAKAAAVASEARAAETPAADTTVTDTPVPDTQPVQPQPVAPAVVPAPAPDPAAQGPELPDAAKEAKGKGKGPGKP